MNNRHLVHAIALLTTAVVGMAVPVEPIVLTFEGLHDGEALESFYNGGTGSMGSVGYNYGVTFGGGALALVDIDQGGLGNFANEPSEGTVMYFPNQEAAILNVATGFVGGFSFYYVSTQMASVAIYDGFNGTGTVLNTLELFPTPTNTGRGDPSGLFDTWVPAGLAFTGTARSVVFTGAANYAGLDNITFGSVVPSSVPEPGTYAAGAFIAAAAAATWWRRRRQAK